MQNAKGKRTVVCAGALFVCFALFAGSDEMPDQHKQTWGKDFKGAKVLKIEHKSSFNFIKVLMYDIPGDKNDHCTEVTLSDALNKIFKAVYLPNGEKLQSVQKHKVAINALPKAVSDALKTWAPATQWSDPAEARKERGEKFLYRLCGKLAGKTIKAEVYEDGLFKKRDKLPQGNP